jgi:hypothetical protein
MNLEVIKFLIENGADKYIQNTKGETVYDLVKLSSTINTSQNQSSYNDDILNVLNNTGKP